MIFIIIYFETFYCFDKVDDPNKGAGDVFGYLLQRPKEEIGVLFEAPFFFGTHISVYSLGSNQQSSKMIRTLSLP